MKIRRNKKGFTIVELVIVIAVIGILTAILIPTFVNLTKKANKASDQSLVTNLNTALRMAEGDNEIVDGHRLSNENVTMHDAVLDLDAYGYGLTKLVTKSGEDLIYSLKENKFYLSNDKDIDKNYKTAKEKVQYLWAIQNSVTGSEKYSVYAGAKWSQAAISDLHVGFDAGVRTDISSISYTNNSQQSVAQNVVIRTNGGALNITAPNDSVSHFGKAETIKIVSIATSSYHENGEASFVEINKGRIVLESDADVNHIHVNAIEGQDAFDEVIIAKSKAVEMPALSRDNVEIDPTNGTLVLAIQNGTSEDEEKDYVWLTKEGAFEQIKVSDNPNSAGNEWISTSDKSEETKSAAQQIANNVERNVTVGDEDYVVDFDPQTREIVVKDAETQAVIEDATIINSVKESAVEEIPDKAEIIIGATLFAGGTGSESDPFLVVDYDTFQHISDVYEEGYYNFKVKDGITSIDLKNWIPVNLNGNFDGNGVVLNNLDMGLFGCADGESSVIKNFTINANISRSGGVGAVVYDSNTLNLTIDSVDVHGTIIGANWVTPYVEFGPGPSHAWNLTIKNSVSDATLVATSGSASGFVGHPYDDVSNGSVNGSSLITIMDSAYIGNMTATGSTTGTNFKYFTINGNDNRIKTYYSAEFIEELGFNPDGELYKTPVNATGYDVIVGEDGSKTFFAGNYGKNVVDNYKPAEKKAVLNTTSQAALPANIGDVFTVTKVSGAVKAVISLQIAPNDQNNYGSYLGTYMSEEIDISSVASGSTFTSKEVKYFTININSGVTSETGVSGNIFNVVNSYYGKNAHNGASVKIVQFDANGNVLNITSIQIAAPHSAE